MLYLFICLFNFIYTYTVYYSIRIAAKMSRTRKTCRYVCRSVPVYNSIRKELSKKIEQVSTYTHRKSWVDIHRYPPNPSHCTVEPWW